MKIKIQKMPGNQLSQYSAAAATFLAASTGNTQVIYTDIDPDITIDAPGGVYELDIDNNGATDIIFSATSLSFISSSEDGVFQNYLNAVFVSPISSNVIAGQTGMISGFAYPYALENAFVIDSAIEFTNVYFQSLAYSFYAIKNGTELIPILSAGNWLNGETDKFIGLRFKIGSENHFGWARLDVSENNNSFTIKDYAYNSIANTAIITDLIEVAIDENNNPSYPVVYVWSNSLFVNWTAETTQQQNGFLQVVSLNGSVIKEYSISKNNTSIDLSSLNTGIYISIIHLGDIYYRSKIYIE